MLSEDSNRAEMMTDERFLEEAAARFKLLGEPMRLRLVRALFDAERSVNELVALTGANQANISRHLSALSKGGLLNRRKEGLYVYYSIADPSLRNLCSVICGSIDSYGFPALIAKIAEHESVRVFPARAYQVRSLSNFCICSLGTGNRSM